MLNGNFVCKLKQAMYELQTCNGIALEAGDYYQQLSKARDEFAKLHGFTDFDDLLNKLTAVVGEHWVAKYIL